MLYSHYTRSKLLLLCLTLAISLSTCLHAQASQGWFNWFGKHWSKVAAGVVALGAASWAVYRYCKGSHNQIAEQHAQEIADPQVAEVRQDSAEILADIPVYKSAGFRAGFKEGLIIMSPLTIGMTSGVLTFSGLDRYFKNWNKSNALASIGIGIATAYIAYKKILIGNIQKYIAKHQLITVLPASTRSQARERLSEEEKRKLDQRFRDTIDEENMIAALNEGANINIRDTFGRTQLMRHALSLSDTDPYFNIDQKRMLWLLLYANADVNIQDRIGRTTLMRVASNPHQHDIVRLLLQKPDIDTSPGGRGRTALDRARGVDTNIRTLLYFEKTQSFSLLDERQPGLDGRQPGSLLFAQDISQQFNIHHPFIRLAQPIVLMHNALEPHLPPELLNIIKQYCVKDAFIDIPTIRAHLNELSRHSHQVKIKKSKIDYDYLPQPLDPIVVQLFEEKEKEERIAHEAEQKRLMALQQSTSASSSVVSSASAASATALIPYR